jgi:chemotaxis protein CheZ
MTANNDSNDLEALFDSIASDYTPAPPVAPPPAAPSSISQIGDSDDLQALFDSVAAESHAAPV